MGRNAINCVPHRNILVAALVSWLHGCDANPKRLAVKAVFFHSKSPPDTTAELRAT